MPHHRKGRTMKITDFVKKHLTESDIVRKEFRMVRESTLSREQQDDLLEATVEYLERLNAIDETGTFSVSGSALAYALGANTLSGGVGETCITLLRNAYANLYTLHAVYETMLDGMKEGGDNINEAMTLSIAQMKESLAPVLKAVYKEVIGYEMSMSLRDAIGSDKMPEMLQFMADMIMRQEGNNG